MISLLFIDLYRNTVVETSEHLKISGSHLTLFYV